MEILDHQQLKEEFKETLRSGPQIIVDKDSGKPIDLSSSSSVDTDEIVESDSKRIVPSRIEEDKSGKIYCLLTLHITCSLMFRYR